MLNAIAIVGRLVADPELRKTTNGFSTTTFRIACDRSYSRSGGERQTDFFDVVAWRNTAEFVTKYFRKGQLIAVDGSMHMRSYEDREGKKRTVYEIAANNVHFVGSKAESGGGDTAAAQDYSQPAAPRAAVQEAPSYSSGNADDFAVIDDTEDLPF